MGRKDVDQEAERHVGVKEDIVERQEGVVCRVVEEGERGCRCG